MSSISQVASAAFFALAAGLALWFSVHSLWPTVSRWLAHRRETASTLQFDRDDDVPSAQQHGTATRVMNSVERQAYQLLTTALPGRIVLAQVPLARFIRMPEGEQRQGWLQRVGALNADLLLCDARSRVLAVVDVRPTQPSERSQRRHARLALELKACGIPVHVWREGALPSAAAVRALLAPVLAPHSNSSGVQAPSHPLIPVPEAREAASGFSFSGFEAQSELETGRELRLELEPVPSAFFDDVPKGIRRKQAA
jgi:Protein of unknown function (DUF2726)